MYRVDVFLGRLLGREKRYSDEGYFFLFIFFRDEGRGRLGFISMIFFVAKMFGLILVKYMRFRYRMLFGLVRVIFSCFVVLYSTFSILSLLFFSFVVSISFSSIVGGIVGGGSISLEWVVIRSFIGVFFKVRG